MSEPTNIYFWSEKNYLKRDSSTGQADLDAPATSAYSGGLYITQHTVEHNLDEIPLFNIFYEPFNDGVIWEPLGTRSQTLAFNPRDQLEAGPYLIAWADSTTVTVEIGYVNNTLTGTYPVYWVIYRDYGLDT